MQYRRFQTNFSGGEIDPLFVARSDTGVHANALSRARNVALLATGGLSRRPGLKRLATTNTNAKTRLAKWEFSAGERYVVAFSASKADFYGTNGVLAQAMTGCPWTEAQLPLLRWAQAADVMIVACQSWVPQVLRRTGATSFTRENFTFIKSANSELTYQPYYKFASDTTTVKPSAATGSITLTANANVFTADHIGLRLRWDGIEIQITAVASGTSATGTVQGELEGRYDVNPFKVIEGISTVEVTHVAHGLVPGTIITLTGCNDTGGITAGNLNGNRQITIINDNLYKFTAGASPSGGSTPGTGTGGGGNYTSDPGYGGASSGDGGGGDGGDGGGE